MMNSFFPHKYRYTSTILRAAAWDKKITVSLPLELTTHELFEGVEALFIGLGYSQRSFENALLDFVHERDLLNRDNEQPCACQKEAVMHWDEEKSLPNDDDEPEPRDAVSHP